MWDRDGCSGGTDLVPVEPTLPLVNEKKKTIACDGATITGK